MDFQSLVAGFGLGGISSYAFFIGLQVTIQIAAKASHPAMLFALSAAVRIGVLLTVGYFVAKMSLESGVGFIVAFLLMRQVAIYWGVPRFRDLKGV